MFPLFVCILFFFSFHQSLVLVFLLFSSIVRSIRLSLFVRRSCTQTYCVCWCFSVLHTCTHHDHHIITISTISKNHRDNKPLQFDRMLNNGRADYAGGSKLDKAGRRHGFLLFFFSFDADFLARIQPQPTNAATSTRFHFSMHDLLPESVDQGRFMLRKVQLLLILLFAKSTKLNLFVRLESAPNWLLFANAE